MRRKVTYLLTGPGYESPPDCIVWAHERSNQGRVCLFFVKAVARLYWPRKFASVCRACHDRIADEARCNQYQLRCHRCLPEFGRTARWKRTISAGAHRPARPHVPSPRRSKSRHCDSARIYPWEGVALIDDNPIRYFRCASVAETRSGAGSFAVRCREDNHCQQNWGRDCEFTANTCRSLC